MAFKSIVPDPAGAPFASTMVYVYGVAMSVLLVFVITKVASPAFDVQAPVISSMTGGGGGGNWQVVISTTVVKEASSWEDNV